jgi:hypothetical protein
MGAVSVTAYDITQGAYDDALGHRPTAIVGAVQSTKLAALPVRQRGQ